jgi:hypothetical protein
MSFSSAKAKSLREASLRRGALESPLRLAPVGSGVSGGEVVGGSVGGGEMLDGSVASVVDSDVEGEEMYSDFEGPGGFNRSKKKTPGAVKLIFPLCLGDEGLDDQWSWNVCGGMIGGPRGSRFCTKSIDGGEYSHCGLGSHSAHKAKLQPGHGYIPSVTDRANTESAFLSPSISGSHFPDSFYDLAGQAMSHEEWLAFLTYLPTAEEMRASGEDMDIEIASEALEKSKLLVSFAVTPAQKKPKMQVLMSQIMGTKNPRNLGSQFEEEEAMDKMVLPFADLVKTEADGSATFAPTTEQWNSLVRRVESLTEQLESAREAVTVMAEISESRFEVVDRQVINLRGSIGPRPEAGSDALGLNLWSSVASLSADASAARESLARPLPTRYEMMTRTLADSAQAAADKQGRELRSLKSSKAEYAGQVKPLESLLEDMTNDLYAPDGSYNKALMAFFGGRNSSTGASGESPTIRAELDAVVNQVRNLTGGDLGGGNVDVNDPTITSLRADIAVLHSDNQTIKASLGGEVVRIDHEAFHSADELKRWVVDCVGLESGTFEFFFDVTSMLESLQDSGRTSDEALDSQALSRKANHRSVSAARMLNSFGVSVPQVMNKKNNSEPFSLVLTYAKWKSNDGRSGLVESIRKSLQLWESRTGATLATRFSTPQKRDALSLARYLMRKSMAFWTSLCNWIDEFYGKLISKTEAQKPGSDASLSERKEYDLTLTSVKEEAWRLVLNVLIDIFQELALKRSDGQAASDMQDDPIMQNAIVLYSTLKAHKFMDELVERRFERHPVMAPTFNGFLFSERASHGDIKRLEIKIGELSALTRNVQSKVDKK